MYPPERDVHVHHIEEKAAQKQGLTELGLGNEIGHIPQSALFRTVMC